jgi:hypothetical protein
LGIAACAILLGACELIAGLGDPHPAPDAGQMDVVMPCLAQAADEASGVFVAAPTPSTPPSLGTCTGNESGCTKDAPCATIGEAFCVLAANPQKSTVYLASSMTPHRGVVRLGGIDRAIVIQGGWNDGFDRYCPPGSNQQRAKIQGNDGIPAVDLENCTSIEIDNIDITTGAAVGPSGSMYGIFVVDTSATHSVRYARPTLKLVDTFVTASAGTAGIDGVVGASGAVADGGCAPDTNVIGKGGPTGEAGASASTGPLGAFTADGYKAAVAATGLPGGAGGQGGPGDPGACSCFGGAVFQSPGQCIKKGLNGGECHASAGQPGCAGGGGFGGTGGTGGGGSFALYAWGVDVALDGGSLHAGAGGSGGRGGMGGGGAAGTLGIAGISLYCGGLTLKDSMCPNCSTTTPEPCVYDASVEGGAAGGLGGDGGNGGAGGDGFVGPSCAILTAGGAQIVVATTTCAYVIDGGPDNLCNGNPGATGCGK